MDMTVSANRPIRYRVIIAGCVSLVAFFLLTLFPDRTAPAHRDSMRRAAVMMDEAIRILRKACLDAGLKIDETIDPNRTCLIGPEHSGIMTTLGHLYAKRTTTNPDMAGLIVHLLVLAGVSEGDTIAIGSSASFPALYIASICAAQAMDVVPVSIISIGASMYGGTNPDFNLLHMTQTLLDAGLFIHPPAAVTLGGGRDIGEGFEPGMKPRIERHIAKSGLSTFQEPDLRENVLKRTDLFLGRNGDRDIAAFINTGGSYANLGMSSLALNLKPGLNFEARIPPENERGVLFEMLSRGIPCIHLLFIRGLATEYGLVWDPQPLPEPGSFRPVPKEGRLSLRFWWVAGPYLFILCMLVLTGFRLGWHYRRGRILNDRRRSVSKAGISENGSGKRI